MQMDVDRLHFSPMNDYGHDKTDNSANNTSNSNYKKRSEEIARLLNKAASEIAKAMKIVRKGYAARKLKASRKIQKRLHFLNTWTTTSRKTF